MDKLEKSLINTESVVERLQKLNPRGSFWIQDKWIYTTMNLREINIPYGMFIEQIGGKNYLKIQIGTSKGFCYFQRWNILNPATRNVVYGH